MNPIALRERPTETRRQRPTPSRRDVSLEDKYLLEDGRILLTGVQALVRLPLDQHRADRRRGLTTGTLVSGYQGSPLGGLDRELQRLGSIREQHHVRHVPGLNEELGATAAWGSQLAVHLPGMRYDGVLGIWYGKAPGLDRAADALRHGNYVGVSRTGGALAVVGDDPASKSSTLPSASETMFAGFGMPVFFPGSVQEVLDLGLHALACSRASGLWAGLKIVTSVADGLGSAEVAPDRVAPVLPEVEWNGRPYHHVPDATLLPPACLELERTLLGPRTELALAYARENPVNRIEGAHEAWLGIVCAGKSHQDLRHALRALGIGDRELDRAGVRILKLGMIWPLEPAIVREFARGLEEVLVVEEKRAFIEPQLKEALYGAADAPRIVGKVDELGEALLTAERELDVDAIARAVAGRLSRRVRLDSVEAQLARLDEIARRRAPLPMAQRTPFFCSGCPHNTSTKAPDGTLVGGGIGCHTMVLLNTQGKGEVTGVTQMGGEGAQWIGMEPFTDDAHFVQNLGDGTFHHSGSLAVRAAVAAGANITYKILYNDHVAMTGGQAIEGQLQVPELTRWLELEGVRRTIVTTEDPGRYRGVELAANAELRHRRELDAAQRELAAVEGVTALIHDQECAAELRRSRKRGKAPEPAQRVWINERVCEGCGDCGRKSSCLSVVPTETQFGRKTQIHQASCNKDYSCLEGDCPSFLTVVPGETQRRRAPAPPSRLADPVPLVSEADFGLRMIGIGGTGVVTVNQVVAMAALIDGLHVSGLDQTGLAQKGGPVVSDLRLSTRPLPAAGKAPAGSVDLYLGFDLLGAADSANLVTASPDRTGAVVSTSAVPTGRMVLDVDERFPELASQLDPIEAVTVHERNVFLDAQELSERLFGDHMPANAIALGAAWQRGLLPISLGALEEAIRLNGAGVEKTLAAFAWGRAVVADPDAVAQATGAENEPEQVDLVRELTAYHSAAYAERYAEVVARVRAAEEAAVPGHAELTDAVARNLFKLMAYKDEYEVARLHLDEVERAKLRGEFGPDAKVWIMLHPPLLRALGLKRKLKLGRWFLPGLRLLRGMRRLRGRWLDPFGHTRVRRTERALIGEYEQMVAAALEALTPQTHATAVELCELPDVIRGYEEIKLRSVERFREQAKTVRSRLRTVPETAVR